MTALAKRSSRGQFEATFLHAEYIFMQGSLATRSLKFDVIDASPAMKEVKPLAV